MTAKGIYKPRFVGSYERHVDGKGRLLIPSDVLEIFSEPMCYVLYESASAVKVYDMSKLIPESECPNYKRQKLDCVNRLALGNSFVNSPVLITGHNNYLRIEKTSIADKVND